MKKKISLNKIIISVWLILLVLFLWPTTERDSSNNYIDESVPNYISSPNYNVNNIDNYISAGKDINNAHSSHVVNVLQAGYLYHSPMYMTFKIECELLYRNDVDIDTINTYQYVLDTLFYNDC